MSNDTCPMCDRPYEEHSNEEAAECRRAYDESRWEAYAESAEGQADMRRRAAGA